MIGELVVSVSGIAQLPSAGECLVVVDVLGPVPGEGRGTTVQRPGKRISGMGLPQMTGAMERQ